MQHLSPDSSDATVFLTKETHDSLENIYPTMEGREVLSTEKAIFLIIFLNQRFRSGKFSKYLPTQTIVL